MTGAPDAAPTTTTTRVARVARVGASALVVTAALPALSLVRDEPALVVGCAVAGALALALAPAGVRGVPAWIGGAILVVAELLLVFAAARAPALTALALVGVLAPVLVIADALGASGAVARTAIVPGALAAIAGAPGIPWWARAAALALALLAAARPRVVVTLAHAPLLARVLAVASLLGALVPVVVVVSGPLLVVAVLVLARRPASRARALPLLDATRLAIRGLALPTALVGVLATSVLVAIAVRITFDLVRASPPRAPERRPYLVDETVLAARTALVNLPRVPLSDDALPVIALAIPERDLAALARREARRGGVRAKGTMTIDGALVEVDVGSRGDNAYHWASETPSLRVSLPPLDVLRGRRQLNLVNPKDPSGVDILLGEMVGAHLGLLVPDTTPCVLELNHRLRGVFLCQLQTDEAWLRAHGRVPSDIVVGDDAASVGEHLGGVPLFATADRWRLLASREEGRTLDDMALLIARLSALATAPDEGLDDAARAIAAVADVDAFLRLGALQTFLGSVHQDAEHNWRLVQDPATGRFEPIVWDTNPGASFGADALIAPMHLIARALLRVPAWEARRREILDELLRWNAETDAVAAFVRAHDARVAPAMRAVDVIDEAVFTVVPRSAPVARTAWRDHDESLVERLARHHAALRPALDHVRARFACPPSADGRACVAVVLAGRAVTVRARCADRVTAAVAMSPTHAFARPDLPLDPAGRAVDAVRAVPDADPACPDLVLEVLNGDTVVATAAAERADALPSTTAAPVDPLTRGPGDTLGPGDVTLASTLVVDGALTIAPGTTLRMGPGVSLVVRGPVRAHGTAASPIRVLRAAPEAPWGGLLVLDGDDSTLSHVELRGGSIATYEAVRVTGMVSFHRGARIALDHVIIADNAIGDDALHLLAVTDAALTELTVADARADGIDIDVSSARIAGLVARRCGNDALDLMESRVTARGLDLEGLGDKGISVGEGSRVLVDGGRIARAATGIQVKDESQLLLAAPLAVEGNGVDLATLRKSGYYARAGCVVSAAPLAGLTQALDPSGRVVEAAAPPATAFPREALASCGAAR